MSAAIMVLTANGKPPPRLEDLFKRPGLSALFRVDAGCVDQFWNDAALGAYFGAGVPVVVEFEDEDDAIELRRRLTLEQGVDPVIDPETDGVLQ